MSKSFIVSFVVGCGLAVVSSACGGGSSNSIASRIDNSDPAYNQRLDDLGIVCESTYSISGSFTPDPEADPNDESKCPDGAWKFTLTSTFVGCSPQPELKQEFAYTVKTDENDFTSATFDADPDSDSVNLKLETSGGASDCNAIFEHLFVDVLTSYKFEPQMFLEDNTISGKGFYTVWEDDSTF